MAENFETLFANYKDFAKIADDKDLCALLSKILEQYQPDQQLRLLKRALDKELDIDQFVGLLSGSRVKTDDIKAYLSAKAAKVAKPEEKVDSVSQQEPVAQPSSNVAAKSSSVNSAPEGFPEGILGEDDAGKVQNEIKAGDDEEKSVVRQAAESSPAGSGAQPKKPVAPNASIKRNIVPQQSSKNAGGIGGWFKARADAFNDWRKSLGGGKTSTLKSSGEESTKGNGSKIAFGVLAGLILIVVLGVLWRLGNENGEYNSSNNSSATSLGLSACTTADGLPGVIRYNITPNPDIFGQSGYTDPQRTLPYETALVFEQGKSYQAIIVGENYRVGLGTDISVYAPVYSFTQTSSECVQEVAVQVLTSGIESQQRASVQLAYKIDFSHWSGWLVTLSLLSILGFTGISMFMSGGKIKDFLSMIFHVASGAVIVSVSNMPPWAFLLFYLHDYHAAVNFGNKSELQEQRDSFEAGNQLRLPESMKSLFESLSRGFGIAGGYDWTYSASYSALMLFVGAVAASASSLVRAFDDQMMAIGIGALFVVFSFAMEAWRRGLVGDWVAFGVGFLGLLDFGIYYSAFGPNPVSISEFSPTAVAVLGWTATFIIVAIINFIMQAASERTELQRDRLADGMLFYLAMKLVAILGYIFYFLM